MLSKLGKISIFAALSFYLFHFLFFGLFETTDSYFFWAFADFLRTGKYFVPHPYYWIIPSTIEPPLYSIFLYLAQFAKKGEVVIHLFHILALLFAAYFTYKIIKHFTAKGPAMVIVSIFLLLPVNIIQTSSLMSETFALFFVAAYIFTSYQILDGGKVYLAKYLLLFSTVGILLRYNFIGFFGLSVLLIIHLARKRKGSKVKKYASDILFIFLSFSIIAGWILINHQLNNSWGLSDSQGKNLYNRIIGGDRLTPPKNDPDWEKLQLITDNNINLIQPSYKIVPYILPKFGMSVTRESQLLGAIAISALKEHPARYFLNTLANIFKIHGNGLVVPIEIYTYSSWMGEGCRTLGHIALCRTIVDNKFGPLVWNTIVSLDEWYSFRFPAIFNSFLLFPSIIFAFTRKNGFIKFCAASYLVIALITVIPEIPVYRYLYPLYPLKIILITYFLLNVLDLIKLLFRHELPPQSK